ncbi:MAG TPA: VOC family protein [Candidatus Limnocylindrales bacterium]|nr:VOC family protein [Candidatus Limnocylindrales bacterium]
MAANVQIEANLLQVVPFLGVADMDRSVRFYIDNLGFTIKHQWTPEGKLRWCWLTRGGASLMLQEYLAGRRPEGVLGQGVSLCFQCEDAVALYHEFRSRGLEAAEPFVGNSMWVTVPSDPDGYKLDFESVTDTPEDTKLSELEG